MMSCLTVAQAASIQPARTLDNYAAAAQLFDAYAAAIGIDLSYQGFAAERDGLPGLYAPPRGELLLAYDENGGACGCVALRPLPEPECCEMKRLYVAPHARGRHLGWRLAEAIITAAQQMGYRTMRLDTLPTMTDAIALYERLGFERIEAYYDTPIVDTVFMEKRLSK